MTVRLGHGKGAHVKQIRMRLDEAGGSIKVRFHEQSVKEKGFRDVDGVAPPIATHLKVRTAATGDHTVRDTAMLGDYGVVSGDILEITYEKGSSSRDWDSCMGHVADSVFCCLLRVGVDRNLDRFRSSGEGSGWCRVARGALWGYVESIDAASRRRHPEYSFP